MSFIDRLNRLMGDPGDKELKRMQPLIKQVRELQFSDEYQQLTLKTLPELTEQLQHRLIEEKTNLDDLLPEAFAAVCRACELLQGEATTMGAQTFEWNMVPYDVQIIGGAVLHKGAIAEMKTGEGKTLVSTMPVYLNALTGAGVHVVTVNDYLAKRDAIWMGMLYEALGLTVGTVLHETTTEGRKRAYECDITYGTNNEFGFDYLRDNMAPALERQVQRELNFAIVDEVDSILIDEARTPLIISQPGSESTEKYLEYNRLVQHLNENTHYQKDEKQRVATLTEAGIKEMEKLLHIDNIYTDKGFNEVHHIEQALRAQAIYKRDIDYVVKDNEIIIVDEFTGRLMPGRRYSNGLHQAIEAKEKVTVQRESRTLATITFQNYFRLYNKLSGMTGTAKTEEEEFESIYEVRTYVIPTNKPVIRKDRKDAIYRTIQAKFMAIAKETQAKHALGQPVLVGTTSIEKSEALSSLLEREGVPHQILNAKHHQQEAAIVAKAGQKGAVTIATNMAGRGTDIKLGSGVADLGGLAILGTERHESRRIDNQLRGRSGRQGDPGESLFFVSMEDDLMRLFGGDKLKVLMERLKVPDDVPLENVMVSRSIESAQKRVEGRNFDIRKHVVQYDDVMNKQREIIYARRQKIILRLAEADAGVTVAEDEEGTPGSSVLHEDIIAAMRQEAAGLVFTHASDADAENWDLETISKVVANWHPQLRAVVTPQKLAEYSDAEDMKDWLAGEMITLYTQKCRQYEEATVNQAERIVTLQAIDSHWMDHIDDMTNLREQVAFAGFAQRDPLIEYKDQGFQRFKQLLAAIDSSIVHTLLQADLNQFAPAQLVAQADESLEGLQTNEGDIEAEFRDTGVAREAQRLGAEGGAQAENPIVVQADAPGSAPASGTVTVAKVGRNDPCPCGSGKKYKKCHGT